MRALIKRSRPNKEDVDRTYLEDDPEEHHVGSLDTKD